LTISKWGDFVITVYYVMKHDGAVIDIPSAALSLIPDDERENVLKRTNAESRSDTLIGRILLRRILYDRFGISSYDTAIELSESGKPYLKDHKDLHFSISHTKNCVACAVGECPIGLDVEAVCDRDHSKIAVRMFTDNEKTVASQSEDGFYRIWTMKESFVKMTGDGIFGTSSDFDVLNGSGMGDAVILPLEIPSTAAHLCTRQADEVSLAEILELQQKE